MEIALQILFWASTILIFHTYVAFPFILKVLSSKKSLKFPLPQEDKPLVSIIVSAFNEESVIAEKIESVYNNHYPIDKFELLIGSDNSIDDTNRILQSYADKYDNLTFVAYKKRRGKQNVVNDLVQLAKGSILILTDANVIFSSNTISEIILPFANVSIGLVDTKMVNRGLDKEGISEQEKAYISREVMIKQRESILWGCMMGPFGGCYAIRKEDYSPVPANALVDDFFINMKILEKRKKCINNLSAIVYEDVSNNLKDEMHRKIRIATGNFQNLKRFKHLLLPINSGRGFSFLSHKVLRWKTPFFLIIALISSILLIGKPFYAFALGVQIVAFLLPLVDYLLKKIRVNNKILRFFTHFYSMNFALLIGFFRFLKGVKSGIWQVSKRPIKKK